MAENANLTNKQRSFIAEYLIDRNATQAAIRAGYSEKTAAEQGSRLLRTPGVKESIEAELKDQEKRTLVTADRVIEELGRVAFLDLRGAFDGKGNLHNIPDMPEDVARAIASVDIEEIFEGRGEEREFVGLSKKLKPCDKVRALELLAKHFKLLTDKIEIDASAGLGAILKAARERVQKKRSDG